MYRKYCLFCIFTFLLLVLSECGESTVQGNGISGGTSPQKGTPGTLAPGRTQTTTGTPPIPSPFPTSFAASPAPVGVSLHTDRMQYQPAETITVTLTNTSTTTLYAWDTRSSCSIFTLEVLSEGQWRPASVAQCTLGRPARMITLTPGQHHNAPIQAQAFGFSPTPFPVGTYRMTLAYATVPSIQNTTNQIASLPFHVQH